MKIPTTLAALVGAGLGTELRVNGAFIPGGNGDDVLVGTTFNDLIVAGAGDDVIEGGDGFDHVLGQRERHDSHQRVEY